MTHTASYSLGQGWKGILASVGVRLQDVLRIANLPEDILSRPQARVSAEQFLAFANAVENVAWAKKGPISKSWCVRPARVWPKAISAISEPRRLKSPISLGLKSLAPSFVRFSLGRGRPQKKCGDN